MAEPLQFYYDKLNELGRESIGVLLACAVVRDDETSQELAVNAICAIINPKFIGQHGLLFQDVESFLTETSTLLDTFRFRRSLEGCAKKRAGRMKADFQAAFDEAFGANVKTADLIMKVKEELRAARQAIEIRVMGTQAVAPSAGAVESERRRNEAIIAAAESARPDAVAAGGAAPPAVAGDAANQKPWSKNATPPDDVLDKLTPQQQKLIHAIWLNPHGMNWNNLPTNAFRSGELPDDSAIEVALKRLAGKLNDNLDTWQMFIEVSRAKRRVKLLKSSRTKQGTN